MAGETGLHADITRQVIGCVQRVHRVLGAGFLEQVYAKALLIELELAGMTAVPQARIDVMYRGQSVGVYFADLLVNECVILELKAVEHLVEAHEVQLVNYLRATPVEVGLLINFGVKLGPSPHLHQRPEDLHLTSSCVPSV